MNAMGCNIKGGGLLMLLFFLEKYEYVCNRERTSIHVLSEKDIYSNDERYFVQ